MGCRLGVFLGLAVSAAITAAPADELSVVATEAPPYTMLTDGAPAGIEVEILERTALRAGVGLHVEIVPWLRSEMEAKAASGTAILGLVRTPAREETYRWVGPLARDVYLVLTRKGGREPPQTVADMAGMSIGALRDTAVVGMVQDVPDISLSTQPSYQASARLLAAGRIDGWAVARLVGLWTYRREGFDPAELRSGHVFAHVAAYLALPRTTAEPVVERWAKALDDVEKSGKVAQIYDRYGVTDP